MRTMKKTVSAISVLAIFLSHFSLPAMSQSKDQPWKATVFDMSATISAANIPAELFRETLQKAIQTRSSQMGSDLLSAAAANTKNVSSVLQIDRAVLGLADSRACRWNYTSGPTGLLHLVHLVPLRPGAQSSPC